MYYALFRKAHLHINPLKVMISLQKPLVLILKKTYDVFTYNFAHYSNDTFFGECDIALINAGSDAFYFCHQRAMVM